MDMYVDGGWDLAGFFDRDVLDGPVGEDADEHEGTVVLEAIGGGDDTLHGDWT